MTRLPLLLLLLAGVAAAQPRLDDAPRRLLASTPRLVPEAAPQQVGYGAIFAATSAIGFTASVTGVLLGTAFGSLSNTLMGALLPGALLSNLLLPPLFTALSAVFIGNLHGERFTAWWPLLGAFAVNAAVYVLASFALPIAIGANAGTLLLYALVDGVVMAAATTGVMALVEQKPVATVRSFVPGVTDTTFVALSTVAL